MPFLCSPVHSSLPAAEIMDRIVLGTGEWSELFAKHDFFHKYRYYLQVIASTANASLQLKWYAIFNLPIT